MSILIKELHLPEERLYPLHLTIYSDGSVFCGHGIGKRSYEAVEVPVPHGRLIDLDALYRDAERRMRGEESMSEPEISLHMDVLRFCFEKDGSRLYAPTVIESEETP